MSTIKSSSEHLTLNADGALKDIILQNNGSTKVTVKSDGNVGIGTTSPSGSGWAGNAKAFHIYQNDTQGSLIKLESSNTVGVLAASNNAFHIATVTDDPIILFTNGTEKLRIDSAGRVTMPFQPMCLVDSSSGVGYTTVAVNTRAPFNNVVSQTGGSNYNTSNYTYTCPATGWYRVEWSIIATTANSTKEWSIRKNGIREARYHTQVERSTGAGLLLHCSTNDVLDLYCTASDTSNMYTGNGASRYSWCSYSLVG